MAWPLIEAIGLLGVVFFLLHYYVKSKLEFWEKRGVKGPRPLPFVGNFLNVFLGKESTSDCYGKAYYQFKDEPLVGVYGGHKPMLVLRDPDLMKDVLIKDFTKFADRMIAPHEKVEPLSPHLFRLEAARWKPLRTKLSPIFTSGKLKEMFHLILECGDHFEQYLEKLVAKGEPIECRDISAKFTTDVIGSCAFGIEINALAAENCEFREMGKRVFKADLKSFIKDRVREYPFLYKTVGRLVVDFELADFFTRITRETVEYRIKNNFRRHDFVDALVELKEHPEKVGLKEIDDVYLTAQAFVFFAAGFETSSITITNTLYEFALNPSIQERARAEIKDVLQKNDGVITYESIKEMKYLNACFQETLRKYPVLLWLSRISMDNYTFAGTKVTIPKGIEIYLPVYAIQRDPEIYPNPETFDPERFTDNNAKSRHPMFFLPFGDGPRNCIGARFAQYQSKVALIKILSKFKVEVCEKTCREYRINKKSLFILQPLHGVYVKMSKLES